MVLPNAKCTSSGTSFPVKSISVIVKFDFKASTNALAPISPALFHLKSIYKPDLIYRAFVTKYYASKMSQVSGLLEAQSCYFVDQVLPMSYLK